MLLFVGTLQESFFAKKMIEKRGEEFQLFDDINELQYNVENIIRYGANIVMIDVSQYTDDVETIVTAVDRIQEGLNCKIIILAKGLMPESQIIQAFYNAGYTDFILSLVLTQMQKDLEACLDGVYAREGALKEIVDAAEQIKKENPVSKKEEAAALKAIREAQKKKIMVGVAGAKHYIGTTTQTVQIAKYFQQAGRTAAIVEMNQSGYFKEWSQMEEEDSYQYDQGTECLTFKGIDIYLDPARITKLIRQKYDCMVYDYGCYYDPTFERASFFEKDIACLVGGSKVNEYTSTNEALLDNMDRENMYYLFSFTSGQDAKEIMSNMKKLADHTMFPAYTPDMFVYSPDNNYERFFKYKLQVDKQAEKKKGIFQIFNRKKVGE